jgi:hypothetical protein
MNATDKAAAQEGTADPLSIIEKAKQTEANR